MIVSKIHSLTKRCIDCNLVKIAKEYNSPRKNGYIDPVCKICFKERNKKYTKNRAQKLGKDGYTKYNRAARYKRKYGLTIEQVLEMLTSQMGMCANLVCGKVISLFPSKVVDMANVDHCHATGKVRGLLCIKCNTVLGHFENKRMVFGLTEYLKKY